MRNKLLKRKMPPSRVPIAAALRLLLIEAVPRAVDVRIAGAWLSAV